VGLCVFLWYARRPSWRRAIAVGAAVALITHVRVNMALLVGVFGLYAAIEAWRCSNLRGRELWLRLIAHPATMGATCVLLLVPWSIRNSKVMGEPVKFVRSPSALMIRGNNPYTYGRIGVFETLPEKVQQSYGGKDIYKTSPEQSRMAWDFILKTHPPFYLFTLLPSKARYLLFREHLFVPWYVYGSDGTPYDSPFGFVFHFPLFDYLPLTMLAFAGFFIRGRRCPWLLVMCWLAIIMPLLLLAGVGGRYRYPADFAVILAAAAILQRALFNHNFEKRFRGATAGVAIYSLVGTAICWALFSGPNILDSAKTLELNPTLQQAVKSELVYSQEKNKVPGGTDLILGMVPINPGLATKLAFTYDVETTGRVKVQTVVKYFDGETTKPLPWHESATGNFNYGDIGKIPHISGRHWRVVTPYGPAKMMGLILSVDGPGGVKLSNLKARGPIWLNQ
ncbi:MAG: hypothetical protein K1X53_03800, partial [Candidatus Sumerlaeaceae bacterium]|nr:hypothetical protein [Candidatus Sumerlaeaceae bacterium]